MSEQGNEVDELRAPRWDEPVPYRAHLDFCFLAMDSDDAAAVLNRIDDLTEGLTGIPTEGGFCDQMSPSDVIKDSPLDKEIQAQRSDSGAEQSNPESEATR